MTGDGVQFGPFADGGDCTPGTGLARLDFSGLNGQPLSALKSLVYRAQYIADNDTSGVGSPTMRVFFEGTTGGTPNRLTFSPNTQFNNPVNYDIGQGEVHEWIVTSGTVRFNDDAGADPAGEAPWSSFMAAHGTKLITNINILNGCQAGTNLRGIVREVDVNGQHYEFGG
jgi:hypothetical protein